MKKKGFIFLGVAVILAAAVVIGYSLWNYAPDYGSQIWDGTVYEQIAYADISASEYLNLYVPNDVERPQLFIMVHGGGFFANDATAAQARYMYEYFSRQGYACASINYRLSGEAAYPAAISDVKAAVRFLRANADTYGYDADRIIIWGESAGAYLATMAAVTNDGEFCDVGFLGEEELAEPVSGKVDVLVDFYGPVHFWEMDEDFDALHIPALIRRANMTSADGTTSAADSPESRWVGTAVGELTEEQKTALSPYTYIQENQEELTDLQVYIRHSKVDITVPGLQSEHLAGYFTQVIGAEQVDFAYFTCYMHASNLYYHSENLETLQAFLTDALSE